VLITVKPICDKHGLLTKNNNREYESEVFRELKEKMDCLNDVNPFKHTLNLTKWDYVTSVILGIVLIPIRVILIAIVVFVAWIGAVIYTHDLFKNPEWMPNSKLRLKTYEVLLKLLAWSFGFVVTLTGT